MAADTSLYVVIEGPAESIFKGKDIPAARAPRPNSPQPPTPDQPFRESTDKASIIGTPAPRSCSR